MSYTIVLNIVLLVVGIIGLNYMLWKLTNIEEIKKDIQSIYYKWLLGILVIVFICSNAIQTYLCTKQILDIFTSVIYTLLSWMCFSISIVYREYLRIPIANVIGYLFYSKKIENLVNCINSQIKECTDPDKCPKDDERSIFEICTLLRGGKLFDLSVLYLWPQLNESNGIGVNKSDNPIKEEEPIKEKEPIKEDTNVSPVLTGGSGIPLSITQPELLECISNLFMTCYHRDLIGDIILFSLTGVLCVYISEYILSTYKCR
jgi:hypothetical protein